MDRIAEFLAMGGYAGFVWPAYGVASAVLVGVLLHALFSYRQRRRELDRLQTERPRRERR